MFFNFFKKESISSSDNISDIEQKSYKIQQNTPLICGYNFFESLNLNNLSATKAWQYYKTISPLFHAVDITSSEVSSLQPVLWDKKEKQYIDEVDKRIQATNVLDLLRKPNIDDTQNAFIKKITSSFLVTGDVFLVSTGLINRPPEEIYYYGKQYLNIQPATDGFPSLYQLNTSTFSSIFLRDEKEYKYYNKSKTNEIWQIKDFNPDYSTGNMFGLSRLSPLYYEIEQYLQGNIHNYTMLKKGARPSGALIIKGNPSQEVVEHLKSQVKQYYQGSHNSHNVMALNIGMGGEIEFKELSINNKDMDFIELKKMAQDAIYKILKIPPSFYDNSSSSYNNKSTDKYNMYNFNIIPLAKMIYNELTEFLMYRYEDGERYEITFIENDIPAVKDKNIEIAKSIIETGLLDVDEGRTLLGYDSAEGKILYNPKISQIPLQQETKDIPQYFIYNLKQNNFSDDEIKEAWNDWQYRT